MGSDIKVYKGCSQPLDKKLQDQRIESSTEGPIYYTDEKGMIHHLHPEHLWIPETKRKPEEKNAVDFIIETCLNSEEKITIVPVGPTSNIGTALKKEPKIAEHIDSIVFMGGSVHTGNVSATAEANFWNDPDSIKVIMDSGAHCVVATLDATTSASLDVKKDGETLKNAGSKYARFAGEILEWRADVESHLGWTDGILEAVHDPLAVAYLIDPSIAKKIERHQVTIDTSTGERAGTLLLDTGEGNPNVDLILETDPKDYLKMWLDYLK